MNPTCDAWLHALRVVLYGAVGLATFCYRAWYPGQDAFPADAWFVLGGILLAILLDAKVYLAHRSELSGQLVDLVLKRSRPMEQAVEVALKKVEEKAASFGPVVRRADVEPLRDACLEAVTALHGQAGSKLADVVREQLAELERVAKELNLMEPTAPGTVGTATPPTS